MKALGGNQEAHHQMKGWGNCEGKRKTLLLIMEKRKEGARYPSREERRTSIEEGDKVYLFPLREGGRRRAPSILYQGEEEELGSKTTVQEEKNKEPKKRKMKKEVFQSPFRLRGWKQIY